MSRRAWGSFARNRAASGRLSGSPLLTQVVQEASAAGSVSSRRTASRLGTRVRRRTRWRRTSSARANGSLTASSGASTTWPPWTRVPSSSVTLSRKPTELLARTTASRSSGYRSANHAQRLSRPPCSPSTALGRPVDPEVWMTYAAWAPVSATCGAVRGRAAVRSRTRSTRTTAGASSPGVPGGGGDQSGQGVGGDDGAHPALGQHPGDAFARQRRVDGQVDAARLQHGEGGHHEVGGARQADRHRVLGADPGGDQVVGQLVGAGVQRGVGQLLVAAGERGGVGGTGGLLGEPAGDGALGGLRAVGAAAVGEQFGQLGAGDRRGLVQTHGGVGDDRAGQRREVPPHPLHGGGVEERRAVLDRAVQRPAAVLRGTLHELPAHLVRGGGAGQLAALHAQPLEGRGLGRGVLEDHHRLDERGARGVALRRHQLHQPLERHVLVVEGGQHGLPDLVQVGGEGLTRVEAGAEDQDVDEEADEGLHLGPFAARHGGAHRDVVLARAPGQQELGQRGQRDEEAGAALAAQRPQPVGHLLRQVEGVHGAGVPGRRRTRPVGRQLQRLDARQLLLPVGGVAVEGVAGEAGPLPGREVGVLHGERSGPGRGPLRVEGRRVPRAQLAQDDLHGGAVGDDVVHPQQEPVRAARRALLGAPGAGAHQQGADQRPVLQVVRCGQFGGEEQVARGLGGLLRGVLRRQVQVPERHRGGRADGLPGHALHRGEGGAQRLVPGHHRVQRGAEGGHVQGARQPEAQPGVVLGRPLLVLLHEPQPLLGEGEGQGALPVGAGDGVPAAAAPGEAVPEFLLHVFRQRTDPGLARRRGVHGKLPFVRGKSGEKGVRTPSTGREFHPARRRPRR